MLLVGSSGTGKTLLCETLSRILGVPFVTAEATSLAQTRYVNEEIEAVLQRLVEKAGGDIARAQSGIVFIDEIDKLKADDGKARSTSGESVQHALLKIMEGFPVRLAGGQYIDTTNILFICGGAFVGLDEIIKSQTHGYGYIAMTAGDNQKILERLNTRVKPTDLFTFGLIPEFTGRLPIIARFRDLTKDMLVRIMIEPKNSIYSQFREIFDNEGAELVGRAPRVRPDRRDRARVQDGRAQPARHLRGTDHADPLPRARRPRDRQGRRHLALQRTRPTNGVRPPAECPVPKQSAERGERLRLPADRP